MAITTSGTTLTFNDATTQTTAPVNTNANVNSVAAGTGISVSATTGALTVTNAGVTSVAAGTGISVSGSTGGVTITNTTTAPNTNQLVKAWVRFDGRANPVTVQASYNISSVTYVDSSTYTLNFTTAMPSTAYAAAGMGEWRNGTSNGNAICMDRNYPPTTGSLTVVDVGIGGSTNLYYYINVAIFSA
jgi:hypothetical protein